MWTCFRVSDGSWIEELAKLGVQLNHKTEGPIQLLLRFIILVNSFTPKKRTLNWVC